MSFRLRAGYAARMTESEVVRDVQVAPERVWAVLADGWLYANWVVGASNIRDVDPHWPAAGACIHHSSGVWPLLLADTTTVLESIPAQELVLQARGWPLGEATVHLWLDRAVGGTRVRMAEDATRGPGTLVPSPVLSLFIRPRNRESLRRLALIAEGRRL